METKAKRREWVKTAAIVLLSVLLVLTFFSNTIMNRSLPEAAAQYVRSGSINARIRGSGTVSANEVYEVTLTQTRKVQSVLVKVGQEVAVGDPLFRLESDDSEELKTAQDALEQMELNYQKSLMEASNTSAAEDRQIQKLREAYQNALAAYQVYSSADPSQMERLLSEAQQELSYLQQEQQALQNELSRLQSDREYEAAKSAMAALESELEAAEVSFEAAADKLSAVEQLENDIEDRENAVAREHGSSVAKVYQDYNTFLALTGDEVSVCANNLDYFMNLLSAAGESYTRAEAKNLQAAYCDIVSILELQKELPTDVQLQAYRRTYNSALRALDTAESELSEAQDTVEAFEDDIKDIEDRIADYADYITQQQTVVSDYQSAGTAAAALQAAEEALEDAVFQASLSHPGSLDMQAARDEIEKQKKLVEELTLEADGREVTANVAGTVSAVHVTAGNTAGADQPIAEITVTDRGYMVAITVTADQARQVRIGDTAQITNYYWGDITATLENIVNDSQSMGQSKKLMFRITGDGVEAGTNLTLSIGQKSANYDCLVPNSAIRTDTNGTFVLVVTSKSSPLGNRYQATRADVQVLASDDTTSAVTGLSNGDFVITTSTKPLEAGDMVRLPDNG